MSDLLIEIGEEMERRYGMNMFFWMDYVVNGGKIPDVIKESVGGGILK